MSKLVPEKLRIVDGVVDTFPMVLAAIPFGVLYGALAQTFGLSIWTTMAMSLFVFAGSSQFVAVNLLLAAAPVLVIIVATFFVNLRHLMYSANLVPHVKHLPGLLRAVMSFWLTDETFAVVANKVSQPYDRATIHWYYLGSALFMYLNWQLCSFIGYQLGAELSDPSHWGLDFAMVVAFIGVIVPLLKAPPAWICAISAFGLSLISRDWPYQTGLIFSMLVSIALAMLASHLSKARDE